MEEYPIGKPDKAVKVGSQLSLMQKTKLVSFFCENSDIFAWSHENMPGISPSVIVHKLNVDPNFKPM